MNLSDKIKIIDRNKIFDSRGWFLKVINGLEKNLPSHTGEVYVISAGQGESRANHYHLIANEWFTLIKGKALMVMEDIHTKERLEIKLDADKPQTIYVPRNIAHGFNNISNENYILVTYSDVLYDPKDTISYQL